VLTTLLALIVVLGVLVFVHEAGHFIAAKWAGIYVHRFSLGLGSSSNVIVERWNGVPFTKPLTRVREAVEALRPILEGGRGPGGFKLEAAPSHPIPIVVANSAPSGSDREPGTGKGLAGLRQRVADAAGTLTWGARADGGFEVRAVLPPAERFVGARR